VLCKGRVADPKFTIGNEGHVFGGASRLTDISQRVGTTVVNSKKLFEDVDEYGQVLNSRTQHISTSNMLNYNTLGDLKLSYRIPQFMIRMTAK
tara:strand:+ start:182 stop:460 length:279 start_codon:yes stop_codon:yes gene_type:complete